MIPASTHQRPVDVALIVTSLWHLSESFLRLRTEFQPPLLEYLLAVQEVIQKFVDGHRANHPVYVEVGGALVSTPGVFAPEAKCLAAILIDSQWSVPGSEILPFFGAAFYYRGGIWQLGGIIGGYEYRCVNDPESHIPGRCQTHYQHDFSLT